MSNAAEKNEIAKFDPSTLVDRVRERVRGSIAELIPEDAWTAMVKREVDLFLNETKRPRHSYRSYEDDVTVPSGLSQVVHAVLTEETKKRVRTMLDSPEWTGLWVGTEHTVSTQVAKLVAENASTIVASLLGDAVQRFVQEINARMQR